MSGPLVSIVIPAFNCGWCIHDTLTSVCSQSITELEVVVVDDGSTDSTPDLVRAYGDKRVRLIQQKNQGHSAATNTGVQASVGKFIKLVDADDVLAPGHIEAQLSVLDSSSEQIASCRWGYFSTDPKNLTPRAEHVQQDFSNPLEWLVVSLTKDEGMMGGWMWLIPREVWNKSGGYNPSLSLNNDFDFSVRLLLSSNGVKYAANAIYCYRKGLANALSQSRGRKAMTSALETTLLGTQALLEREDSERIRRICADRLQMWIYELYPEFPDLVEKAETRVKELGGSKRPIEGGVLLRSLAPIFGWKFVRCLQHKARSLGWNHFQKWKQDRKHKKLH